MKHIYPLFSPVELLSSLILLEASSGNTCNTCKLHVLKIGLPHSALPYHHYITSMEQEVIRSKAEVTKTSCE